jgi:hypothetical protein
MGAWPQATSPVIAERRSPRPYHFTAVAYTRRRAPRASDRVAQCGSCTRDIARCAPSLPMGRGLPIRRSTPAMAASVRAPVRPHVFSISSAGLLPPSVPVQIAHLWRRQTGFFRGRVAVYGEAVATAAACYSATLYFDVSDARARRSVHPARQGESQSALRPDRLCYRMLGGSRRRVRTNHPDAQSSRIGIVRNGMRVERGPKLRKKNGLQRRAMYLREQQLDETERPRILLLGRAHLLEAERLPSGPCAPGISDGP